MKRGKEEGPSKRAKVEAEPAPAPRAAPSIKETTRDEGKRSEREEERASRGDCHSLTRPPCAPFCVIVSPYTHTHCRWARCKRCA